MRELSLRRACASDAAAIAAIHVAARRKAMPYPTELYTDDEVRAWGAGTMLPDAVVWVAKIDGELAGYMAPKGTDLEYLYVASECQGREVGSLLLTKDRELSPAGLELYAFQRYSRARTFYEAQELGVRYAWPGRA